MSNKFNQNRGIHFGDLVSLEGLKKVSDIDVKFTLEESVLDDTSSKVSKVAEDLENNQDITVGEIADFGKSFTQILEKMQVDYYGDKLSMEEYLAIKDLAKNNKLLERICELDFLGHGEITYLPQKIAEILKRSVKPLYFSSLVKLSLTAARELSAHKNTLYLPITEIDREIATEFAKHKGRLILGLKSLSSEVARILVEHEGDLEFDGLPQAVLTKEIARILSNCKGVLAIRGRTTNLDFEVFSRLCESKHGLKLPILSTITPEMAKLLKDYEGDLSVSASGTVSDEVLEILVSRKGEMSTNDNLGYQIGVYTRNIIEKKM